MSQLTYPRTAESIAARARMNLGAYRAVPGHEAAYHLDRSLHDMWGYRYFALRNGDDTPLWTRLSHQLTDTWQLLRPPTTDQPDRSLQTARAAIHAINCFEQATGLTPGAVPEPLYTRTEAEQAAHAAFDRLRLYIKLDHDHDRRFVTEAFLAFLDSPDSPYPYKSHEPDEDGDGDGDGGEQPEPELSPEETGERGNSLLCRLGPRTEPASRARTDNP